MITPDEPAYPSAPIEGATDERNQQRDGLTKRELIAAMMLQGLAAEGVESNVERCAKNAVTIADSLIAALNAKQP